MTRRLKKGEEIIVNCYDDGEVEVKAKGFKGGSCYEATQFLEKALGRVKKTRKTSDYFKQRKERERVRG